MSMTSRRDFLNQSLVLLAAGRAGSTPVQTAAGPSFYRQLVQSNNESIPAVIRELAAQQARQNIRRIGTHLTTLAAGFYAPESALRSSESLIAPMEQASRILLEAQHGDGTIDSGNLNSPPDTGFVLETVCSAMSVLRRASDPRLARILENLTRFVQAGGDALVTGGVHTPNHRWVICSALARIHSLLPASKYVSRIDDWLGEGIDIDGDGQFSERSTGIYSRVTDEALIAVARLLNRPNLLDHVRKNLDMMVYYLHPDGEVETVGSRRQDQFMTSFISNYYLEYRYLAIRDRNPLYAAVVGMIEQTLAERVKNANPLIHFLDEPLLKNDLPVGGALPADYARVFPNSALARIRRDQVSATVYGGSDWPMGVGSGLASNPTFLTFRKGKAVLESVRMGADFFSEGVFRSMGLVADGNRYSLSQRFDVPYYLPLPKGERNAQGDYPLTPARDERFWSKLNFPRRQMGQIQTLDQKITIVEDRGAFELRFDVSGHKGVPVAIELGFRPGGKLEGAVEQRREATYLKDGMGVYRVGQDAITFGPGIAQHERIDLSGSSYKAHGAPLRSGGLCVYITGFTPLQRVLTITAA